MYLFDTNIITHHQRGSGIEYDRILRKIANANLPIRLSMPSFEEHVKGWLAVGKRAKIPEEYASVSQRLYKVLQYYAGRDVIPFDLRASAIFRGIKSLKPRTDTMDLRIAAIALANNATLVTRNLRDFVGIPSLRVEDWTK